MKRKIISLKVITATSCDSFNSQASSLLSVGFEPYSKLKFTHNGWFCQQFVEFEKPNFDE